MRLIDADALYEKTAEWEARALSVIEKLNRKPFEEMDSNEITEWRKWSCILNERSAFKHDVADAPTVEPQQWIPVSSGKLPKVRQRVLCQCRAGIQEVLRLTDDGDWECIYPRTIYMKSFVVAWMPLPMPWEGGA